MRKLHVLMFLISILSVEAQNVSSPSKTISLSFKLSSDGKPTYSVNYKTKPIVKESSLGIAIKESKSLETNFRIDTIDQKSFNETWQPVLGEQLNIKNSYNEMTVALSQPSTDRKINIIFRVFDEGIAFRYEFPKQKNLNYFIISDEKSQFNLVGNHKAFWIPGDYDSQEYAYNETKLSEIDNSKLDLNNGIGVKTIASSFRVQSPLMMKSADGIYINVFEAAVVNYPIMHLDVDTKNFGLTSNLVPNAIGDKAYLQAPCVSPWRTIMMSDDAREIVSSKMILNLNEPSKIEDTSWIKPMKYVGVWWEMHVGKSTWDYAGSKMHKMLLMEV